MTESLADSVNRWFRGRADAYARNGLCRHGSTPEPLRSHRGRGVASIGQGEVVHLADGGGGGTEDGGITDVNGRGRFRAPHPVRGSLIAVLAVTVIVPGGLLVLAAVASMVLTGLDPRNWLSPNAAHWLGGPV